MDDPVAVGLGTRLLAYLSVSGLFTAVALTYTGGLQGTGGGQRARPGLSGTRRRTRRIPPFSERHDAVGARHPVGVQ